MTALTRVGMVLGLVCGIGLALVWLGLPIHRKEGLGGRVLPYLKDTPRPSRLLQSTTANRMVMTPLVGPIVLALSRGVERVLGGADTVIRRQQRAGRAPDVERFRAEQVLAGAGVLSSGVPWAGCSWPRVVRHPWWSWV